MCPWEDLAVGMEHRFGPAHPAEPVVMGAARPGYPSRHVGMEDVDQWLEFVKGRGTERVVCLLTRGELDYYKGDLLEAYREGFSNQDVLWSPVPDFHLCDADVLWGDILPFLEASDERGEPAVVHCSGGSGRAGHVMVAWLTRARGYPLGEAVAAVENSGRNPRSAVTRGPPSEEEFRELVEPGP